MALLAPNIFAWTKSTATDVTGYRVRALPAPAVPDYTNTPIDVGDVAQVDFAQLPAFAGTDGVFNLALSAVDDGGNESDLARVSNAPLDLVPPDAPTNFRRL